MSLPAISVVVPVHRHWELVPGLLAALAAQSFAGFETILVNDDDAPPPALPGTHRVLHAPGPGAYAARNAGAAAARAPLLAFTDADCRPDPGWLAALAAAAAAAPGTLLAGPVRMLAPATPTACARYELVRGIPQARYVAPRLRRHRQPGGAGGHLPRPRRLREPPLRRRRRVLPPRRPRRPPPAAWCPGPRSPIPAAPAGRSWR